MRLITILKSEEGKMKTVKIKNINIKNRDIVLVMVILVIILSIFKEMPEFIKYTKTDTVVGEIVAVKVISSSYEEKDCEYDVYIVPLGAKHRVLEVFTLIHTSEIDSGFSIHMEDMPELTVGNIVELEYRLGKVQWKRLKGQEIIKIKQVDAPEAVDNPEFPLIYNEEFVLDSALVGAFFPSKLLYSERIDEYGGYLFYMESINNINAWWISDEVLECVDETARSAIENSETGIEMHTYYSPDQEGSPFVDRDITAVYNLKAYRRS
jgi:hypothetical protein